MRFPFCGVPLSKPLPAVAVSLAISSLLLGACLLRPVKVTDPLPPVVIDAHSHIFNANYLPVSAICRSRGVPPLVSDAIEIVLLSLTENSEFAESLVRTESVGEVNAQALLNLKRSIEPAPEAREDVLDEVFSPERMAVVRAKLSPEQRNALLDYIGRPAVSTLSESVLTAEDLARALEKAGVLTDRHTADAAIAATGISGYLRFIGVVTSSERVQLKTLSMTFPKVDLFVAHMMDLENTYNQMPTFPFALQVRKMMDLQAENPGNLLVFGAFDPFRRESSLAMAREAYDSGVAGF
jgi:hypothetical protein